MALTDKLEAIAAAIRERTGLTGDLTIDQMIAAIGTIPSSSSAGTSYSPTGSDYPITSKLTSLGNAIRAKTGGDSRLTLAEMPNAIRSIDDRPLNDPSRLEYDLWTSYPDCYVVGIGTYASNELVIPSSYMGQKVTRIDTQAFKNCKTITSVTIPESVDYINSQAFKGCTNLATVNFSNNPTFFGIGEKAFADCSKLKNIILYGSDVSIGSEAFSNSGVQYIQVDPASNGYSSDLELYENALLGANALETLVINTNVEGIKPQGAAALKTITFGASCSTIGGNPAEPTVANPVISKYAFADCANLEAINFYRDVTVNDVIGAHAFDNGRLITVTVYNDSRIWFMAGRVGEYAFKDVAGFNRIDIGCQVAEGAFYNTTLCTTPIKRVSIGGAGVGKHAFWNNTITNCTVGASTQTTRIAFDNSAIDKLIYRAPYGTLGGFGFYGNVRENTIKEIYIESTAEEWAGLADTSTFLWSGVTTIYLPWSKGEIKGAPWGAPSTCTIHYDYTA